MKIVSLDTNTILDFLGADIKVLTPEEFFYDFMM